jgi:type III pantothenate kinase
MRDSHVRLLLLDIGNTHCHVGVASPERLLAHRDLPTSDLASGRAARALRRIVGGAQLASIVLCSVVPFATRRVVPMLGEIFGRRPLVLTARTVRGVGLAYPRPETIGPDRLANAIAARRMVGAPAVVVDFGTAVTFDILDRRARYIGGIIAPGLAAMTDYLHEKTALLPRIRIREITSAIGRSTEEAMLVGAVHGYRGLIRGLIAELKRELGVRRLPVVATGGYAALITQGLREINSVRPHLTLEGLRYFWMEHHQEGARSANERPRHPHSSCNVPSE